MCAVTLRLLSLAAALLSPLINMLISEGWLGIYAFCKKCGASTKPSYSIVEASAAWNNRPQTHIADNSMNFCPNCGTRLV